MIAELVFRMPLFDKLEYRVKATVKTSFLARYLYPRFYSQTGEDAIIFQYFGKVNGTYLDIGSGRPIWYSNTYFLYKRGWRGILVDPISKNIFHSKLARPRDKSIQAAISDSASEAIFFEFDPPEYSTFNLQTGSSLQAAGVKLKSQKKIRLTTLSDLPLDFLSEKPLLINIDTEGFEFEIIKSIFDLDLFPDMILVEEHVSPILKKSAIQEFLKSRNFYLHAYTGLTSIYVQDIHSHKDIVEQ
jgi:FkbM family methyltransferase